MMTTSKTRPHLNTRPVPKLILALAVSLSGVAHNAHASDTAQVQAELKSDIRADSVRSTCRGYQQTFAQTFSLNKVRPNGEGSRPVSLGRENKKFVYDSIVESGATENAKAFLEDMSRKLLRTRSADQAQRLINDPQEFLQPCYNAIAQRYDQKQQQSKSASTQSQRADWGAAHDNRQPLPQTSTDRLQSVSETKAKSPNNQGGRPSSPRKQNTQQSNIGSRR